MFTLLALAKLPKNPSQIPICAYFWSARSDCMLQLVLLEIHWYQGLSQSKLKTLLTKIKQPTLLLSTWRDSVVQRGWVPLMVFRSALSDV
jgi:hypothetical protein